MVPRLVNMNVVVSQGSLIAERFLADFTSDGIRIDDGFLTRTLMDRIMRSHVSLYLVSENEKLF